MSGHNVLPSSPNALPTEQLHSGPQLACQTLLADRFTVVAPLGSGAQAAVYRAHDELLDVEVAIKLLAGAATDPHTMQTLRNEVLVARKIQHPNIIRVHDVFSDGHDAFFTMALVTGLPLCERLLSSVSPASYDKWRRQLLEAVLACQSAGIHHGDIKPDNILITDDDDLMLIDFGIGHSLNTQQHTSGHLQYAAPEVINNGISTLQSDTFSAGMVLQEVLAAVPVKHKLWDWRWRQKRQRNNARLTRPHPEQRPKLSNVLKDPEWSNTPLRNRVTIGLTLVLLVGVIVAGLSRTPTSHTPALPDKTLQLALLHDEQYPLLGTMTRLLRYPMALHPDLALVSAATSKQLIQNLALRPLHNDQDRLHLATTLDADLILTLDLTPANTGQYLLHATMILMPANEVIFTQTQEVASGKLAAHLEQFSATLIDTLFAQLTTPVALPDLSYLEALTALDTATTFDDALAQLQQQAPDYPGTWLATAQYAADNNDIAQSREALSTLASFSDLHPYWKLQGNLLTAQLNDDLPLAQQSIQALVEAYPDRPELLATRANIYQWANDLAAAEQDYQRAIELQPHNGQWLFQLARLQILRGDFAAALDQTLTKALVAYRRSKDPQGESLVLNAFGIAHLRLAEYEQAQRYFEDALSLRNAQAQPDERAKTLANLAIVGIIQGSFDEAEGRLQEALALVEAQRDQAEQAHIMDTFGFLYEEQGRYPTALKYYKHGLDLRVQMSDTQLQPESMSNVAYMHFLIGDIALAEIYWQQALSLFSRNNDQNHQLRTQQNLIHLKLMKGDNTAATRELGELTQSLSPELGQERLYQHLLLSYLHFARGSLKESIKHTEAAQELAQQAEDPKAQLESSLWMGEICLKTADWPCLEQKLTQLSTQVDRTSSEQQMVYRWLKLAHAFHQGERVNESHPGYLALVNTTNMPIHVELKILLDMQERFELSAQSLAMQKADQLHRPVFYQTHLQWLYLKAREGDEQSLARLEQQLAVHPDYWRNHLYYSVVPASSDQQQTLLSQWLQELPEEQIQTYQETYLE